MLSKNTMSGSLICKLYFRDEWNVYRAIAVWKWKNLLLSELYMLCWHIQGEKHPLCTQTTLLLSYHCSFSVHWGLFITTVQFLHPDTSRLSSVPKWRASPVYSSALITIKSLVAFGSSRLCNCSASIFFRTELPLIYLVSLGFFLAFYYLSHSSVQNVESLLSYSLVKWFANFFCRKWIIVQLFLTFFTRAMV